MHWHHRGQYRKMTVWLKFCCYFFIWKLQNFLIATRSIDSNNVIITICNIFCIKNAAIKRHSRTQKTNDCNSWFSTLQHYLCFVTCIRQYDMHTVCSNTQMTHWAIKLTKVTGVNCWLLQWTKHWCYYGPKTCASHPLHLSSSYDAFFLPCCTVGPNWARDLRDFSAASEAKPQTKLNLVHFSH